MNFERWTLDDWLKHPQIQKELLNNSQFTSKIPLLNYNDVSQFQDTSLVRFRGMVQDMYGPEYYVEEYEVVDKRRNVRIKKSSKYRDVIEEEDNAYVNLQSDHNVLAERQTYLVISTPALNDWVFNVEQGMYKLPPHLPEGNLKDSSKRKCVKEDEPSTSKKQRVHVNTVTSSNPVVIPRDTLNFPVYDPKGQMFKIKIYENLENIKLNTVMEFVGFLSGASGNTDETAGDEQYSSIPSLHCIKYVVLDNSNPLDNNILGDVQSIVYLRKELQIVLTQLMLGDSLASEYLLLHLMTRIHTRVNADTMGKFTLNISNVPTLTDPTFDFVFEVYKFIQLLLPKSYFIPMSLENMNTLPFVPKKDYECNRLISGILQLSDNTHLVLDETKLCNGTLNQDGIMNVQAIGRTITEQKILYNFNYYQIGYECDLPVLIFSQGKSLLPFDYHVVLKPDDGYLQTFREIVDAAKHFLQPELLNKIRVYLSMARWGDFGIPEEVQQMIQEEYVRMRLNSNVITGDDLHSLLVVARLVSISYGKTLLDPECWRIATALEKERRRRLLK